MKRLLSILLIVILVALGVAGQRYYTWVNNTQGAADPFDEVGIDLHRYMPGFVQDWGCARLKTHFGTRTLPPYGCQSDTEPGQWK